MKTFFQLLVLFLVAVAIYFSFWQKKELEKAKEKHLRFSSLSEEKLLEEVEKSSQVLKLEKSLEKMILRKKSLSIDLSDQKQRLERESQNLESQKRQILLQKQNILQVEDKISHLQKEFPNSNFSLSQANQDLNILKREFSLREQKLNKLQKERKNLREQIEKGQQKQNETNHKWRKIANNINLLSRSYQVQYVEKQWGIVVIDAGKEAESAIKGQKLLIYRNGDFISSAKIIGIEDSLWLANIDGNKASILVGDKAILND